MKTNPTAPAEVRQRISEKLRARQTRASRCAKHQLYEKMQQMSLLCRLFNKQVRIELDDEQIVTPVYLATPQTVILKDGRFIPLSAIRNVNIC